MSIAVAVIITLYAAVGVVALISITRDWPAWAQDAAPSWGSTS